MKTLIILTLSLFSIPVLAGDLTFRTRSNSYGGRISIDRLGHPQYNGVNELRFFSPSNTYQGRWQAGPNGYSAYNRSNIYQGRLNYGSVRHGRINTYYHPW